MRAGSVHRRRRAIGVVAVLVLWPLGASAAFASTGTVPGSDRAAAVQSVLDRVLGPGNSTVVVSDTIQTSAAQTTSVQWGSGIAASVAKNTVVSSAGTSVAAAQQNLVGRTTTVIATPAGSLVHETVAVAVDRAHLGSTSPAALRKLVTAAAGIVPSRGDRVSVVIAKFARPVAQAPASADPLTPLLPYAVPAIWVLGTLIAVLIVAAAVRNGRRGKRPGTDVLPI